MKKKTLRIIALIQGATKNLEGFRVLNEGNGKVISCTFKQLTELQADDTNYIITGNGTIELTDGDILNLPVVQRNTKGTYKVVTNDYVIVLGYIEQSNLRGNYTTGYVVTDYEGIIMELSVEEALAYQNVGYYNAKVGLENGKSILVPVRGSFLWYLKPTEIPQDVIDETNRMLREKGYN